MYRVFFLNARGQAIPLIAVHMCIVNARRTNKGVPAVEYSEELNAVDYLAISFCEFIAMGSNDKTIDEVAKKYAHSSMVTAALAALKELGVHKFLVRTHEFDEAIQKTKQ